MSNYYLIHTVNLCAVHVQRRDWRFGFNLALFLWENFVSQSHRFGITCDQLLGRCMFFFLIVMEMKEEEKKIGYGELINWMRGLWKRREKNDKGEKLYVREKIVIDKAFEDDNANIFELGIRRRKKVNVPGTVLSSWVCPRQTWKLEIK